MKNKLSKKHVALESARSTDRLDLSKAIPAPDMPNLKPANRYQMSIFPIYSSRLKLRPFQDHDQEIFEAYRSDPDIAEFQSWSSFSHEDACRFMQRLKTTQFGTLGEWFQLAIAHKETNLLLGDIGVRFQNSTSVEIGFTLEKSNQKKGFAIEAIELLLSVLFERCGVSRVIAITDERNLSSVNLLHKIGMKYESSNQVNFKGALRNELNFALNKQDPDRHIHL